MRLRPALLAAAALAAAIGSCLALGRWGAGGNATLSALAGALQQGEEMAPHIEAGRRRADTKRALAAEVVAGRMTLREAAERFRRLDPPDPGYPTGLPRPPRDERFYCGQVLEFAWEVLARQGRFAAAARWYAEAFTDHPHLLAGPPAGQRYYAARAAALAAAGRGRDAADLDEEGRAGFRRQALDWLRAELRARQRLLEQEPEETRWIVTGNLQRWLEDSDFAGVRGSEARARLPEPERQAWHQLWADVAATRARAQGEAPPVAVADREVRPPGR
jgi:hypothetical protein